MTAAWFALGAFLLQDPGPSRLESRPPAGPVEIRVESTLELDVTTVDSVGTTPRQIVLSRTEVFRQEPTGPDAWKIHCATARLQRSGTNLTLRTEALPLEDKTFHVTRENGRRVVKTPEGEPAPVEADTLGAWEDVARLLPKGEAAPGTTWRAEPGDLAGYLSLLDVPSPSGGFEMKVEKLEEGRATISFRGSIEGKSTEGFQTTFKVTEGTLVFDGTAGRPVSLTLSGSVEATRDVTQMVNKLGELTQTPEKVGEVRLKTRRLELKIEFK